MQKAKFGFRFPTPPQSGAHVRCLWDYKTYPLEYDPTSSRWFVELDPKNKAQICLQNGSKEQYFHLFLDGDCWVIRSCETKYCSKSLESHPLPAKISDDRPPTSPSVGQKEVKERSQRKEQELAINKELKPTALGFAYAEAAIHLIRSLQLPWDSSGPSVFQQEARGLDRSAVERFLNQWCPVPNASFEDFFCAMIKRLAAAQESPCSHFSLLFHCWTNCGICQRVRQREDVVMTLEHAAPSLLAQIQQQQKVEVINTMCCESSQWQESKLVLQNNPGFCIFIIQHPTTIPQELTMPHVSKYELLSFIIVEHNEIGVVLKKDTGWISLTETFSKVTLESIHGVVVYKKVK